MLYLKREDYDRLVREIGWSLTRLQDNGFLNRPTPLPDDVMRDNTIRAMLFCLTGHEVIVLPHADLFRTPRFEPGAFPKAAGDGYRGEIPVMPKRTDTWKL